VKQEMLKALYYADSGPITVRDIENTLVEAGLNKGDTVMVHSDVATLGKMGDIRDRDEFFASILNAFLGIIGNEGTLIVPTYTYSFCRNETFDVRKSKSTVGALTEFVRKQKGAIRSEDPIFSHAAIGKNAEKLLKDVSSECFGGDSFFDRFYKSGGKIINLGKFFDITFLYYIENKFGVNYRYNKKFSGTVIKENGSEHHKEVVYYVRYLPEEGRDVRHDKTLLGNELEKRGLLKRVPLGEEFILCSKARDCFDVGLEMLGNSKYAFLTHDPNVLEFKRFAFYVGVTELPDNKELPESLPFALKFDKGLSLIEKQRSPESEKYLQKAYAAGCLASTNLGSGTFGARRADDALKHLLPVCGKPLSQASFLEIGCANGYLLYRLMLLGANNVTGCEPGPMAREGREEFGLNIINDFYNPEQFSDKFDVIFSYGVLEHVHNPVQFLELQQEVLKENGKIFAAVPNCERKINLGDFGILSHQHISYFTEQSLKNLLIKSGLTDVDTAIGRNRAMLYAWGRKSPGSRREIGEMNEDTFYAFCTRIKRTLSALQERVSRLEKEGKTLGLYGGGFNTVYVLDHKLEPRFFDRDTALHGKYYPGYRNSVENPRNLLASKVDELWIMAVDYDEEIISYLKNELKIPEDIYVFSFKQFLESALPGKGKYAKA